MVTILRFTRIAATQTDRKDVLMRLLKRAAYSTADLSAVAGRDYTEEQSAILSIRSAMIDAGGYPKSPRTRRTSALELETWENEGGAFPSANDGNAERHRRLRRPDIQDLA